MTLKGATVSPELNFKQIKTLNEASTLPLECIVHGNMELMVSEYCVLGSFLGNLDKGTCTKPCEKNNYWLCDRKMKNSYRNRPILSYAFIKC